MHTPPRRHLVSIRALSSGDLRCLVRRAGEFASGAARPTRPLDGCVVGIYFRVTSTRTRTAFTTGAQRLGASVVTYGPGDLQLNTGETIEDTARVLSGMLDGFVARTAGSPADLDVLAGQDRMAVINAMSEDEHPTQALADLTTLAAHLGSLEGVRLLYVGEGNNTASALAHAFARLPGSELHLRTPRGYGLPATTLDLVAATAAAHGARVAESHDLDDLPRQVDAVYTTRWQTTGTSKADPNWREHFAPFRVDDRLMRRFPGALFMHDLPAHRGDEVTAEVLDGPASVAFEQAENKLHSAMAALEWCLGGGNGRAGRRRFPAP